MSTSKNTHLTNGWEAFSYFCCSAWNDTYLIDISKANLAGDLRTQRAQFVPVTQIYTSIDNLMSQQKLYSVFEYPMAPDISSNTKFYNGITDSSKNLNSTDASNVILNPLIKGAKRLDYSGNLIGQGIKCRPKMYDCAVVNLTPGNNEFTLAVTPTRIPYFGQNQGNIVANTKPQRVLYIVSAELHQKDSNNDTLKVDQMKIVSDPFDMKNKFSIIIKPDMNMKQKLGASILRSEDFGNVTTSYSYNWDIFGGSEDQVQKSGKFPQDMARNPLSSNTTSTGGKYLVISSVPTLDTRDKRENVHDLKNEFYGVSPTTNDDSIVSFGYLSYQSLGGKTGIADDLKNSNSGYLYPRSSAYPNPSVFEDNWFTDWETSYGDLANALQGTSSGGSDNFAANFTTSTDNQTLAFSKLVNQSAIVNTNFLKKLLYIKTPSDKGTNDQIKVYITVVEDWTRPGNALDSYSSGGTVNGAAYIPYLDVNASRQIVCPDYDIWDNSENKTGRSDSSALYSVGEKDGDGDITQTSTSTQIMMPHQNLDKITAFPKWRQSNLLPDNSYENNKDMILFDWRAKTLAQPTFACCELDKMVELGENSSCVNIDQYAGKFISNEFTYTGASANYVLDANIEFMSDGFGVEKGLYIHGYEGSASVSERVFKRRIGSSKIFKNNSMNIDNNEIKMITARITKIPWFTWDGEVLPVGAQSTPKPSESRCIISRNALTAIVSIIRTASLLITGMVMNTELTLDVDQTIDTITTKTLNIAWYNTKSFFEELEDLPISSIFNKYLTEDHATNTISMPNWLEVFKKSTNPKIAQFFRSKLCNKRQLNRLVKEDSLPLHGTTDTSSVTVVNTDPITYNVISDASRCGPVRYPDKQGPTYKEDMYSYSTDVTDALDGTNLLRGFVRAIMWDPSGTYPYHALIPKVLRGEELGDDWEKLAYISSDGTLRNNGNCLQSDALNYRSTVSSETTRKLMYCTPYIPVGRIKIVDPNRSITTTNTATYEDKDLYRHQGVGQPTTTYQLDYGSVSDVSDSPLVKNIGTATRHCGPKTEDGSRNELSNDITHIPKGIGYRNGKTPTQEGLNTPEDPDEIKIDLARSRRRLSIHTITKGMNGTAIYLRNNNMGIGPLCWSDLQERFVETGDGYHSGTLLDTQDKDKDFYITDSLYRTQSVISLLLSGYGLYSDETFANNTNHKKVNEPISDLYQMTDGRKRFLSGPTDASSCCNMDLLNLRVNNGDEITGKTSIDSAYKWVGPSSHFLMEPNTSDIWRYIKADAPLIERNAKAGRNSYATRSEAFASGGSGLSGNVKTYLHNGNDTTESPNSAIGSAYESNDFYENRPSLFAMARGFDISRNSEIGELYSKALENGNINFMFDVKEAGKKLSYCKPGGGTLDTNIKALVDAKKVEIVAFTKSLENVVASLCTIEPCSDRAPIHLTDHQFTTLASDETLSTAKIQSPYYNDSLYLRLGSDAMDYLNSEMSLLDLTGITNAKSETNKGGALVEGMYYIDDLCSNTIRIFYPTPLREEFVRPDKANSMVSVSCYLADTCKGDDIDSRIAKDGGTLSTTTTDRDTSFNNVLEAVAKGLLLDNAHKDDGALEHFIFGRGGIVTKKRQSILELLKNLPNWGDLRDTSGGKFLKDFIADPSNSPTATDKRTIALNPDFKPHTGLMSSKERDIVRYQNMSVLTITGVRDFALALNGDDTHSFDASNNITIKEGDGSDNFYKKRIYSRIGSIILPGTNKNTKYIIANHENDRSSLSKDILKNLEMGNIDDNETKNYALKGYPFKLVEDKKLKTYYLQCDEVPAFIASSWNDMETIIFSPSMSSEDTGVYEPKIKMGKLLDANYGIAIKRKNTEGGSGESGASQRSSSEPLTYTVKIYTVKSVIDSATEPQNNTDNIGVRETELEGKHHAPVIKKFRVNLMLRSVTFEETEATNYYKLNTLIFLNRGSVGGDYKQVSKFIKNMPENLTQYLGFMNRIVTGCLIDYPSKGFKELNRLRTWCDICFNVNEREVIMGSETTSFFSFSEYNEGQLHFENMLIKLKAASDEFDKQLLEWNKGIVGSKIGDMKLDDFDNISGEQIVDSTETLTEIPGFHILMWVEKRPINDSKKKGKVITPEDIKSSYVLSSGNTGNERGLYDGIKFSLYEQDLLVKRGALTIQNEQILDNRTPVVKALASRGSIVPEKKYEYGVYKENMWLSMYENGIASEVTVPIINEIKTINVPDSIGLNTSQCEKDDVTTSVGVLIFQNANVLYEKHSGINITLPASLKQVEGALIDGGEDALVFCMCVVPENNNQIAGKTGVNPSNTALLSVIVQDENIGDVNNNQWSLCYEEIFIKDVGNNSEFGSPQEKERDLQINMLIDLYRSKNTTKVLPIMTFNKLPRMEKVKKALIKNCIGPNAVFPAATYAPFLEGDADYASNFAVISRFKYHVDSSNNELLDTLFVAQDGGYYTGAGTPQADRESLMDLFYTSEDTASNMFTITSLEAQRSVSKDEMNGCNAYTGGVFPVDAEFDPYNTTTNATDAVKGNVLHHYRKIEEAKTGHKGLYIETLIYFTSLLTRPLLNGADSLGNVFWKIKDTRDSEWNRMPSNLLDVNGEYQEGLKAYRKCLVSTLIHSLPSDVGRFTTNVLNRSPPASWKENGKLYDAFPQLEFCATFRGQLIDKSLNSDTLPMLIKEQVKFPIYCYLDEEKENIIFPSWKESGYMNHGVKVIRFEEKINYEFARDYYGPDFIETILSPERGFGFVSETPSRRVLEFKERLKRSKTKYITTDVLNKMGVGSATILKKVFGVSTDKGTFDGANTNEVLKLSGPNGYLSIIGAIQMWTPLLHVLFELKEMSSPSDTTSSTIQSDIVIGSHVNTFKNKFDIQNFQLKLNTVRLDINLLKECTAFEIKEIEFCDNTLLTLDTLTPVGNAQNLFLPIMIKTKAEKVESVKSRKVEITTDYLLETLNKMDILSLMNNIWYRIDEKGNRIVLSPTEVGRVPLFRNTPSILFNNNYEPMLKHTITDSTKLSELVLEPLTHVDGSTVSGVAGDTGKISDDKDWAGMGWCLNGIGQRLGFAGGFIRSTPTANSNDSTEAVAVTHTRETSDPTEKKYWEIHNYGLTLNDVSGNSGKAPNNKGVDVTNITGAHRQEVSATQNTGGFVRSAWLAERLSTIVFGKQDFPSFSTDDVPFNDEHGSGNGGKITSTYDEDYYMRSNPLMTIISDDTFGRLKLADVKQDDSARGQLRDYRYPGKQFDNQFNVPIFAESTPNTNGTFACQVIRMIKSGLLGRPEDDKILINEQNIIDQINGGVYMAYNGERSNVNESLYKQMQLSGTPMKNGTNFDKVVMNPQQFMYLKLQEKRSVDPTKKKKGGFVAMQYVLQQLLSNDPQRFVLNENEAKAKTSFITKGNKNYNRDYKDWRTQILDKGHSVDSLETPLQIMSSLDTGSSGHPKALCIRGLDLDHTLMNHIDLSDNTWTAATSNIANVRLAGRGQDTSGGGGFPLRIGQNVNDGTIFKYGPQLHLTEGNSPFHGETQYTHCGRYELLEPTTSATWKGNNMYKNDVWNSYIEYTDMTKTYPIYMLPLMDTDTISIVVTNEGSLKDPLDSTDNAEQSFKNVLEAITNELKGVNWTGSNIVDASDNLNINNTSGTTNSGKIGTDSSEGTRFNDFPSITGHGTSSDDVANAKPSSQHGIYHECVNLLVAPEIGPFEKLIIDEYRKGGGTGELTVKTATDVPKKFNTDWSGNTQYGELAPSEGWLGEETNGDKKQFTNALEAYYTYLGMTNYINPGGTTGQNTTVGQENGRRRASYLAVDLSHVEVSEYYQKFVSRSFTIKYKFENTYGNHVGYNDIRINQLASDQTTAFKVKDDDRLPKKEIHNSDSDIRYEFVNYSSTWGTAIPAGHNHQYMIAKPPLLTSDSSEYEKAQGSILIPRRFDGRPMDPNIKSQNVICIRSDTIIIVKTDMGIEIRNPSQKDVDGMTFSLDIGLPMKGGGLIRCKLPLKGCDEDSLAFFQDAEYNKDYLLFSVTDWKGGKKGGGQYPDIDKQNILFNLHEAMKKSQIAQLSESLLEPYTPAIATRNQQPPNEAFKMPVILPSKPGGSSITIGGTQQPKTYFQPLDLVLNSVAGSENDFLPKMLNYSYYIRISANNTKWTNYMTHAEKHAAYADAVSNGNNVDISDIIHNIGQTQLTGNSAANSQSTTANPQIATIYSLDLLALLNTTYDISEGKITHRIAPSLTTRPNGVELRDVIDMTSIPLTTETIDKANMKVADLNKNDLGNPILVVSDISKSWVDYEGQMMGRDRFFRLCDVLGDPSNNYALAMDNIGDTSTTYGDLVNKQTGKYKNNNYKLSNAAVWDICGNTGAGNVTANEVQKFNNPLQHLHYGSYTTLDDPTTGAGCVGFPDGNKVNKEDQGMFNGGNIRKQFHLGHHYIDDDGDGEQQAYAKDTFLNDFKFNNDPTTDNLDASGVFFPATVNYFTNGEVDFDYESTVNRMVHPSALVLSKSGTADNSGIWQHDRKTHYTMSHVFYHYKDPSQNEQVVYDVSENITTTLFGKFTNNSCETWKDIYGDTTYSFGDGFVDNSRYRKNGSSWERVGEAIKRVTPYDSFKSTTTTTTTTPFKLNKTEVGDMAWMDKENQERYFAAIRFFSAPRSLEATQQRDRRATSEMFSIDDTKKNNDFQALK